MLPICLSREYSILVDKLFFPLRNLAIRIKTFNKNILLQCDKNGKCLVCNEIVDFRVLSNSSYRCVPKRGYFDNKTRTSASCPAGCAACQSVDICFSCINGSFLLDNGQCSSACYPRFYPSEITNVCIGCPYDCLTCDFRGFCLTCSDADYRVFNSLTKRCVPVQGYYD